MKKLILFLSSIIFCFNICLVDDAKIKDDSKANKTLIVYYSWGGNTKVVAKKINEIVKGTIFEIELKVPYTTDYKEVVEQAKKEIQNGVRPELKENFSGDLLKYDTIFIGSPNWWGTVAPVIMTFIEKNNLEGKTIIPFITHGSGGRQNTISDLEKALPKSTFKEALILNGSLVNKSDDEIKTWLNKLGY